MVISNENEQKMKDQFGNGLFMYFTYQELYRYPISSNEGALLVKVERTSENLLTYINYGCMATSASVRSYPRCSTVW